MEVGRGAVEVIADPTVIAGSALAQHYRGKRVLLTGHTGFKGGWLALWLHEMGAEVFGLALAPPTRPSLFELASIGELTDHCIGDIRDADIVRKRFGQVAPDIVLHLAAQPIVRESYRSPLETLATNVMGTAHILDAARDSEKPCAVVIVTSDKCYANQEWVWGYRENEPMGGKDPYSMSKGAAELVTASWRESFFSPHNHLVRIASARAGNVIGGGDWAADRIVADAITALCEDRPIDIRSPLATRPWQHVLEPLSGYLLLGARLMATDGATFAEGWNFGPDTDSVRPVGHLADLIVEAWGSGQWRNIGKPDSRKEAMSLGLNCDKAFHRLGWRPTWRLADTVRETVDWYQQWHSGDRDLAATTRHQIARYFVDAKHLGQSWAEDARSDA